MTGKHEISTNIIEAIELPKLIRLERNLCAAAFCLMKLIPAHFILNKARDAGLLRPGSIILESTSGTFGLALAMLCNQRGYRLILVSDPAIDSALQRRLEDLGATVDIVHTPARVGGYQQARLDRLADYQSQYRDHFWTAQYANPHNPGAYAPLADMLAETLGSIDYLVGTVGSGGSMCGAAGFLRRMFPQLRVIGVDTPGSVIFGQPDGKRLLRGLGNSLMPENVDHSAFDEIHWVGAAEGFAATRLLHRKHALFMGPTSGAAYLVARWLAQQAPTASVVVLLPDEGYRYQDTVYNDAWLKEHGVWQAPLPSAPQLVAHPQEAGPGWSRFHWNRQTYEQVVGASFCTETLA